MIGKALGHYQITSQLGKGGMGEVYRAKDQVLGRDVAIKVLPEIFAWDADRVARFQHEAKVLASLNHPNIAAIHGLEQCEGKNFLVLELVEGQTLADRIKAGPIPMEESLKLALQIAEALEEAHGKGIVHRDLKPANIKVTSDNRVKVLDFGLAKQLMSTRELENQEETLSAVTKSGTVIGTIPYMSPEQLQGHLADARSDLFSFGILLYEMLSGIHPFGRASSIETASAILNETPPALQLSKRKTPNQLQGIIKKLLAKNPDQRYQSALQVRSDLSQTRSDGQAGWGILKKSRLIRVAIAVIVLFLGAVLATWWMNELHFRSPQVALAFQKRDWILIADFENLTSDRLMGRSLQTATAVGIQQSQYVNVFPQSRVQEALRRMRRESGATLDEALACDLAVREGVKAVLVCSIGEVGGVYSLTARLVEPNKRTTVISQTATASGKNKIIPALDTLVKQVRQNLGESLSSISLRSLPLPEATTASLDALKIYAESETAKNDRT